MHETNGKLVVFDLDGTLFQAQRVTIPAVQETFAANGLHVPGADEIGAFIGRPAAEYHQWLAGFCSPEMVHDIVSQTDRRELELIGEAGCLFPGVLEMLTALERHGYRLAMSSNAPDDYFAETLRTQGLSAFFSPALCRGTRFSGKVEMVGFILEQTSAKRFVVVGDRRDDIECAHAYQGLAVAVTYGFGTREELADADAWADEPSEVTAAVERLIG